MKLVIGYDGSDSAQEAIRALHSAGLPDDVQALVVCVADISPPRVKDPDAKTAGFTSGWDDAPIVKAARALADESRQQAQALAAEGADFVKHEFPRWKVSYAGYAGSPYLALVEASEAADLLILGSQGRNAVGRFVLGSVSQNVLSHARCSVRVSRLVPDSNADAESNARVRILLGIDGSPGAALAVSAVAARAWPARTEVRVVAVLDTKFWTALANPQASAWAWAGPGGEDGPSWAGRAVDAVVNELRSQGLESSAIIESGDPKRVLLDQAEQWKATCIFVGAKGHNRVAQLLIGSVSAAVAARAHCSVEVVRQG